MRLQPSTLRDRSTCQFVHRIRTRFAETDAMGIIHHGAYAPYLEEARAAFLDAVGRPYDGVQRAGLDFTVVELFVDYRRPLRFGDDVDIGVALEWVTRTAFQVGYVLEVDGDLRATAATVHAAVDAEGRPQRLPTWMAELTSFGRPSGPA